MNLCWLNGDCRALGRERSTVTWLTVLALWGTIMAAAWAADFLPSRSTNFPPFLRLREATLTYTGPETDFTNLTEIRLGWFGPCDPTNALGADMWWAANLAVREANAQGGCGGLPVRLVPRWASDPWRSGVSQLARMVYDEFPLALLGSIDSASTHLAEQIVAKANLPLVSPVATDKSTTLAGVSWMFSCAPTDDVIARPLVAAILASLQTNAGRFVLVSLTDHESRMASREVLRECSRRGRLPDFHYEVSPGASGLSGQMRALAQARPSAVLVIGGAEDAARVVTAARHTVPAAMLFGGPSLGRQRFRQLAGSAAEEVRFPLLFAADPANGAAARFVEVFQAEHQRPPDDLAALTYDATRLLLEAIRQAGPNRARLREVLARAGPWQGIAGPIHFDGTGQNTRTNISIGTIRNGLVVPATS